jgi:hypothetical protein
MIRNQNDQISSIIQQLERQRTAIDKAITALREIFPSTPGPKKRVLSEAARKAIGDAVRKRWKAVKKARKTAK